MRLNTLSITMLAALLSTSNFAAINANPGFYLGADLAMVHYHRPEHAAFGGFLRNIFPDGMVRPYIGYRLNDFFALEAGYNDIENENRSGNDYWGPDRLRLYSFDLAGKAILPFESGISLFGKAGLALTHQYVYNVVYAGGTPIVDATANRIQPLLGAGMSYNFTKNLATDLSASYYFPAGSIGEIEMLALGLSYTFGGN